MYYINILYFVRKKYFYIFVMGNDDVYLNKMEY